MDGDPRLEVRAFGLQLIDQRSATSEQLADPRIAAGALELLLVYDDHRLLKRVVQLVPIERAGHSLSVPQATTCIA